MLYEFKCEQSPCPDMQDVPLYSRSGDPLLLQAFEIRLIQQGAPSGFALEEVLLFGDWEIDKIGEVGIQIDAMWLILAGVAVSAILLTGCSRLLPKMKARCLPGHGSRAGARPPH